MLDFDDVIDIYRQNPVTGEETQIYNQIEADIQANSRKLLGGQNSNNSEMADYFIFVKSDIKNLKAGDVIKFNDYFNSNVSVKVSSRDLIDFEEIDPFIEILCKLL